MTVVTSLNKTFRCSDSESSPMDAQEKVVSSPKDRPGGRENLLTSTQVQVYNQFNGFRVLHVNILNFIPTPSSSTIPSLTRVHGLSIKKRVAVIVILVRLCFTHGVSVSFNLSLFPSHSSSSKSKSPGSDIDSNYPSQDVPSCTKRVHQSKSERCQPPSKIPQISLIALAYSLRETVRTII